MLLSIPPRPSTRPRLIPGVSLRAGDALPGRFRALSLLRADRACAHLAALHIDTNQRVEVQILLAMEDATEAVRLRFLADARKAAALRSPHVDRILHVGITEDGHPFVVREPSSGQPLAELLARMRSLPTESAVDIAIAIATALESAHALGLVHAELDPTMVHLEWRADGPSMVKVCGLGTSRALAMLPTDGRSFISVAHRAPELLSDGAIDARVDVWGVGVLLYTMLAGAMPFAAESPSKTDLSATGDEPAMLAGVPEGLGEIVDACLARDPAVRPPSAASLAARLALFGAHPVFEKRVSHLVVDTGPYDAIVLERALKEAERSDRDVTIDLVAQRSSASSADKTPAPVMVPASSSSPPLALTLAPPAPTLAPPARRWRTAALALAACITVSAVAVVGVRHRSPESPSAAAGPSPASVENTNANANTNANPNANLNTNANVAPPTHVAPPTLAVGDLPVATRPPPAKAHAARAARAAEPAPAVDPIVRSAAAPIQPQPKAPDDDLRRFLDDRR